MNLDYIIEMCLTIVNYTLHTVIVLSIIGICGQHINHFQNIDKILNNTKDGELINEFFKIELEKNIKIIDEIKSKLFSNTKVDLEKLQSELGNANENINSQLEKINTDKDPNNLFNVIDEFTYDLRNFLEKFLDDSDIFDLIMNFIYNWNDMLFLSQLSLDQLNALNSLTSGIVILICILNIISVLFPNF